MRAPIGGGLPPDQVSQRTRDFIDEKGWLS